ncbi:SpoIIE family protein phosphatase [Novispirillum sp. DQ9]|uniref:SpoIIE family protein phosphatase n=1 Tax=Novispirillum sp. DQ9 TaxID=3398612 RepID=UPI003C7CE214
MRLHHKLMLVLALFGLLPTLAVGWLGRDAVRQIEAELSERGRDIIRTRLTERLTAAMTQAAAVMDHQRAVVELGLRVQVDAAEARLAAPGEALPGPLPLAPAAADAPDDAAGSAPLAVAGAPPEGDIAARLATMGETFRAVRAILPEAFLWQSVATTGGTLLTYPPHGGFPEDYDPRAQTWFKQAAEAGGPVWATPGFDAATGELVLTAAAPVRGPDGALAAVTSIDVSVLGGIERLRERASLPGAMTALLVNPGKDAQGRPALDIVARAEADDRAGDRDTWKLPGTAEQVTSGDRAALHVLAADIARGGSGVARLPYDGVDSLWAYGSLETYGGALVFVVPFSRIEAMSAGISDIVAEATKQQLTATGGAVIGILLFALFGAWLGARTVSEPLIGLREAVDRVARGDMEARAPVVPGGSRDEVAALSQRFNAMVPLLQDRLALRQALSVAQEVQQALLPQKAPDLPGFDIAGTSQYCDETGGDYFDYVPLRRDAFGRPRRMAVLVGDVAGHGVASALMMTTTRALLRSHAEGVDEPGALLAAVNPLLAADAQGGRFMTVFALFLSAGQPVVSWSSAGHDPALAYDPASDTFADMDGEDIPLGIDPDWMFAPSEAGMLEPGQVVVLATDGIFEARDEAGAMFGKDRLRDVIRRHASASAADLLDAILRATADHRGAVPPRDDATVVVVKVV